MRTDHDNNFFDLGDKTALVCVDHPQIPENDRAAVDSS